MDMQIRAISEQNNVKISIVDISEGMKEIAILQKLNPLATVALGRTIINNSLLSLSLKNGCKMSSNINGMGLVGTIIAEFENNNYRGYVQNPEFDISLIDEKKGSPLSQVVGTQGFLQVTINKDSKNMYTSRTEIITGEVNMDYMFYTQNSDQLNTLINSVVKIDEKGKPKKACGILIQLLPNHNEEDINLIEEKIGNLSHLNDTLEKTTNYESLIKDICNDSKILSVGQLNFKCSCNEQKVIETINLLDKSELEKIKERGELVEVVCDFCKKQYNIKPEKI